MQELSSLPWYIFVRQSITFPQTHLFYLLKMFPSDRDYIALSVCTISSTSDHLQYKCHIIIQTILKVLNACSLKMSGAVPFLNIPLCDRPPTWNILQRWQGALILIAHMSSSDVTITGPYRHGDQHLLNACAIPGCLVPFLLHGGGKQDATPVEAKPPCARWFHESSWTQSWTWTVKGKQDGNNAKSTSVCWHHLFLF